MPVRQHPAGQVREECATPLARTCPGCATQVSPSAKFCPECAHPLAGAAPAPPRVVPPESYTPKHLAEKILTSRIAMEGERKQVTVLFADLKGSMELLADRDPEEARKLLDGAPVGHEDHAVRACYAALRMQRRVNLHADEIQR
jgi:hypothetical protein